MNQETPEPKPNFETTDPEWGTDFGPPISKRKRLLWATACIVFVLGFLAVAIMMGGSSPTRPAKWDTGIPTWVLFIPFAVLLVVIGLTAERIALWIQRKLNWKPDID
jgi:Na+-driven multidrug efflux pump